MLQLMVKHLSDVWCRRPLFREPSVIRHNKGLGEAAFDWRGSQLSSEDSSVEQCTASIFIEPVLWMKDDILAQEGKVCSIIHSLLTSLLQ
jgi:hypothetical protein